MRNVVVSEFMSLDGVMEALNVWRFPVHVPRWRHGGAERLALPLLA